MKKQLFFFLMIAAIAGSWASCKDKDDDDAVSAEIMIEEPAEGATFAQGDTIMVHAMITGSAAMHGWEMVIRKKDDQTLVYADDAHDHAATYHIHADWVNNVSETTQMEVVVTAILNHDGATSVKTTNFTCQP